MQVGPSTDLVILGLPGIVLGLIAGYTIGGRRNLRLVDRLFLGIVISTIGGLILSLGINVFIPLDSMDMVFEVLSFLGGYILGLVLNWEPPDTSKSTHHIIYEPEDDDEAFDREIEEALGGKK
jgi:hypothetical protein